MRVKSGRMVSVPYSLEFNDYALTGRGYTPEQLFQMICDQLDVLYTDSEKTGRVMSLCIHPYFMGHPYWSKWLDRALSHIREHSGVWVATWG